MIGSMTIMLFGTFDLLHPGHLFVLREAGKRGDVIVIVARDRHVRMIKGISAHESEDVRVRNVQQRFPAYIVALGDPEDFLAPIRTHRPDRILLGYDQQLPPSVRMEDLPPVERLAAFEPERHKSSLARRRMSRDG